MRKRLETLLFYAEQNYIFVVQRFSYGRFKHKNGMHSRIEMLMWFSHRSHLVTHVMRTPRIKKKTAIKWVWIFLIIIIVWFKIIAIISTDLCPKSFKKITSCMFFSAINQWINTTIYLFHASYILFLLMHIYSKFQYNLVVHIVVHSF